MSQAHRLIRRKMRFWAVNQELQNKKCLHSAHVSRKEHLSVWTDHRKLWKQPGLWDGPTRQCQGGNWLMKCSCRRQPRPLGSQPVSQQPCLPLVTHHEIARVGKLATSGVSVLIKLLLAFPFVVWSCFWVFFKLIYREFHRKTPNLNPAKATAWNSMAGTFE